MMLRYETSGVLADGSDAARKGEAEIRSGFLSHNILQGRMMQRVSPSLLAAFIAGAGTVWADGGSAAVTTDSNISAAVVESWGMQAPFFRGTQFEMISWENAQRVLLAQDCIGGKQYHTGWVTIYTRGGKKYLVKPPAIDDIFSFFKKHGLKGEGFAPE